MATNKHFRFLILIALICSTLFVYKNSSNKVHAVSAVSITSPTAGQEIPGTNITVHGTASPDASVILSSNNISFAQTKADGSGNWSVNVSTLPAGQATITAKAINYTGSAYFTSTPDGGTTTKVNQMLLSDNSINTLAGYPLTLDNPEGFLSPSPTGDTFYASFGLLDLSSPPRKFIGGANPAQPTAVPSYPTNAGSGIGVFSADGSLYYSNDNALNTITVVNVDSVDSVNTSIPVAMTPFSMSRSPNGDIYASESNSSNDGKIEVISSGGTSIAKTIDSPCPTKAGTFGTGFSSDTSYPFYFVACMTDHKIVKMRISDDSIVDTFSTPEAPTGLIISADNSKVYYFTSVFAQPTGSDKIGIVSADSGETIKELTLTNKAIGFFPSPDLRSIYVATPGDFLGGGPTSNNIDVVDMLTDTISQSITTPEMPLIVSASAGASTTDSNISVSFVLGVSTTTANAGSGQSAGGSLAKTGEVLIPPMVLLGIIIGTFSYIYVDYREHKKPLLREDPKVKYTLTHHVKKVTIPLVKYRISLRLERKSQRSNKNASQIR